ncbi:hypothetical protein QSH57_013976 [Fusarium oxysporum f. sp. vasinfectum]|nr:hypothetical protein QSH57_013976 [Fusarium oxysporum f. sp. vasinfectum]
MQSFRLQQYREGPQKSLFFNKLNHDIRQLIYRELLGSHRTNPFLQNRLSYLHGGKIHTNILLTCKAALNEGIHLFYQLNTFYFTVPTDLIQFFTDTNSTAVDQIRSYELRCVVENTYDKPILDLDVLTWVLDRYLRPDDVKVKLEIVSEWACRPFSKACKEKAVEALGRFLALRKLGAAVVVVPHIFKEVMQKTLETLGPHISAIETFAFH